jgi:hypothetical protein
MYGSHPPSHKGKHQNVTLAYRLLVAVPAKVTNQSNLQHENESLTQHYTFSRRFLLPVLSLREDNHHRMITLGPCITTMYPQEID